METLRVTITFILGMVLPFAVQRWDRRRLTDEQREGAWNAASWGAALYAFGPLSMIGWLWVTRHQWDRWRAESILLLIPRTAQLLLKGLFASLLVVLGMLAAEALLVLVDGDPRAQRESVQAILEVGILALCFAAVVVGLEILIRLCTWKRPGS